MKHPDRLFIEKLRLLKCSAVQQSLDIISTARNGNGLIAYHPLNKFKPLIDCFPTFYAVQVTIGRVYDAQIQKIKDMVSKLI